MCSSNFCTHMLHFINITRDVLALPKIYWGRQLYSLMLSHVSDYATQKLFVVKTFNAPCRRRLIKSIASHRSLHNFLLLMLTSHFATSSCYTTFVSLDPIMFHISSSCDHKHDSWSYPLYARHVTSVSIASKLWSSSSCRRSVILES